MWAAVFSALRLDVSCLCLIRRLGVAFHRPEVAYSGLFACEHGRQGTKTLRNEWRQTSQTPTKHLDAHVINKKKDIRTGTTSKSQHEVTRVKGNSNIPPKSSRRPAQQSFLLRPLTRSDLTVKPHSATHLLLAQRPTSAVQLLARAGE